MLDNNQLFPADNPWNQKITNAPVASNSSDIVNSIGASSPLHPDFGTTYNGVINGIPYNVVSGNTQPKINLVIGSYASESDIQPIPIPDNAIIEGDLPTGPNPNNNSDRHLIVYDQDNNILYETFSTHRPSEESDGMWHAACEAVWDLKKDSFRTPGWTSADAAGLPILPGLVRVDEVLDQGLINHALRFTVSETRDSYMYPASHYASSNGDTSLPPMGMRFRLKASVDISSFSKSNQVILQALKDYGMIVADNGGDWFVSGAPSPRWSDDDLHNLTKITGNDFEVVDLTPIVSSLSSQAGWNESSITINGLNFTGGAGKTSVYFGSVSAINFQIISDTQIVAVVPPQPLGTVVNITVVSPYGTSVKTVSDQFTYGATPTPTPIPTPVVGSLKGLISSSRLLVNLTNQGTIDWAAWGKGTVPGFNHKVTGNNQISPYSIVGNSTAVHWYDNDPRAVSWVDGTPAPYSNTNHRGVYISGIGNGFSITVPADTTKRTLNFHVGGWHSGGKLIAHLSDNSAEDFTNITINAIGQYDRTYTLVYNAESANQTLEVTWVQNGGTGNVTLNAAALSS